MPQRESAIVGKNNVRAHVTGQEELLVKVNSFGDESDINATIKSPLSQQGNDTSVSVTLSSDQAQREIYTNVKRYIGEDDDLTGVTVLSVSFASVGTANARISFDGGSTYTILKPGETLNLDAGAVMNYYGGNLIFWDTTTNVNSELIVAYNYI